LSCFDLSEPRCFLIFLTEDYFAEEEEDTAPTRELHTENGNLHVLTAIILMEVLMVQIDNHQDLRVNFANYQSSPLGFLMRVLSRGLVSRSVEERFSTVEGSRSEHIETLQRKSDNKTSFHSR